MAAPKQSDERLSEMQCLPCDEQSEPSEETTKAWRPLPWCICKDKFTDTTASPWSLLPAVAILFASPFLIYLAYIYATTAVRILTPCALTVFLILITSVVYRAYTLVGPGQKPPANFFPTDPDALERCLRRREEYAQRLAAALRCKTVSVDDSEKTDESEKFFKQELYRFHVLLQNSFPLVHSTLIRTVINEGSLIYEWRGSNATAQPYMVYAHLDVVPAPEPKKWSVDDPFAGEIRDGFIWGRGAIDDKHAVMGHLEAIEDLISSGFRPNRTIFLCFGHDEETGGMRGAAKISLHLSRQGVHFEFMLDEGLFIIDGVMPCHRRPVAMICVAEKGYLTTRLSVEKVPGHASAPPTEGAIGILARAVSRLERNPFPLHHSSMNLMIDSLVGGFHGPLGFVMSNMWLFGPLVAKILGAKDKTATLVRTTTALTVFQAGNKENVLPGKAVALVNHRIHPNDTVESVIARDRKTIGDCRVKIDPVWWTEPSPVSSAVHPAYNAICACVHEIFPEAAIAPGLFVAASDSKHFWSLADQIYRFSPVTLREKELDMFHGIDERISVDNYARLVAFFRAFHVRQGSRC